MEDEQNECCGGHSHEEEQGCCKGEECCGGCSHEEIDLKELGPEAEELGKMFEDVDSHLNEALKARMKILEAVHTHASQSPEMKEKMEKVIKTRHPVLVQFVFGMPE